MRLTDLSIERNFLYNVTLSEERLQRLQDQASSGKNFLRPQDDPIGVQRSISLNHQLTENTQYLRNIDRARTWLENAESGLAQVTSALTRAHELGLQAINGTTPLDGRQAIAMEILELRSEIESAKSFTVEGRSVLTGMMPEWRLGPGVTISPEDQTLMLDAAIQELGDLAADLADPVGLDKSAVQDILQSISGTSDQVLAQRAQNGARVQRIETLENKMQALDIDFQRLISDVEEPDLTKLLVRLKSAEASYQAALGAGARLIQPTLLDYLG